MEYMVGFYRRYNSYIETINFEFEIKKFLKMFYFLLDSFQYYVFECLGPDVPATYLLEVNFEEVNGTLVTVLDNNTETVEFAATMAWLESLLRILV